MSDRWIPRLYVIAQILIVVVCAGLMCLDHDNVVTDLFLAAAGGLIFTQGYRTLKDKVASSE